jgi:hypothetical protein
MREVVTWSIQIMSVLSRVMASPPQTYCGLRLVMWTFWMMTFLTPLTIRMPLPLMTPLLPTPMRDLLDLTVIPRIPALSYLTLTLGALACSLVHQSFLLMAVWQPEPVPQGAQPVSVAVPSVPVKSKVRSSMITRFWESPRYETSSALVLG